MENENSSIFQPYEKYECWRGEKQTILKTSIGRQLPYIVNFKKNQCQIFNIEWERVTHSYTFPEGCNLIDVDYFPTEDGLLGILLGVEDPRQSWGAEHFVVALVAKENVPKLEITHSAEIPTKITVVKTLFSSADMADKSNREVLNLYHRLMTWKHVVAIGCKDTECHLARLTAVEDTSSLLIPIHNDRKNLINLMGAFTDGTTLQYTQNDGSYRDYPIEGVYITALALMPRSRTLLVGLSMGGILAASLNPSNQMNFLELRHERIIREIAPLEPEDDPDKFEYFIAAVDASPRHPIMIQLWRGSFKTLEEVETTEKYDRPYFAVCLEHKILFGEKWISVNPIVTEREHWMTMKKRGTDESIANVSHSFGSTSNRNSVLLSYERQKMKTTEDDPNGLPEYIVEAAVFDIDAWYYKRVPGRVSTDGTVLKQCAFLSTIKSNIRSEDVNDIGILTSHANDVSRFSSSISDADQLFYPSALSYERIYVAKSSKIEWMKIQNIQDTILNKCASKLSYYLQSPESISNVIIAAGLVRKNILSGSPNSSAADINHSQLSSEQKVILNLIVYYGKVKELCEIVNCSEISDTLKNEIAEWSLHEAIDYKRTISDKMVSIFQGRSYALSPLAQDAVTQGIKLFRVVYEYIKTCSKALKSSRLHNLACSVKCVRNHTKLTYQFITFNIIPVDQERQQKMREMHSKRKLEAIRNSSSLPIQSIVRNMNRIAPNAQFWNDIPHHEWYPPTPVDLLESLLNVNISERIKRELVIQYIIDWIRASPNEINLTDKQIGLETIKIMTNQMLDVDLEKIYYVLDQEKKALIDDKDGERIRALGEKVFSLQNEQISYEKLWGGGVPVDITINAYDMKRFEERMKLQLEQGECRLPVLDPESEMLYQVYLFENEKFHAMSSEAIRSNKLLSMFMPGMVQNKGGTPQKSSKEREIHSSVKTMFDMQTVKEVKEKIGVKKPSVFAKVADENRRRKRSNQFDDYDDDSFSSVSSVSYVPPTAKRIQQWKKAVESSPIPELPVANNSSINSLISSDDPNQHDEINMLIATPARYYKRPNDVDLEQDLLSPSADRVPPLPAQNSILKTAKAVQSANRGRIRFHESVPRGADESVEDTDKAPKGLKLNFAILEDDEEEETMTTRRSKTIEMQDEMDVEENEITQEEMENDEIEDVEEEEENEEECIESEKTFENQDDFEVLEDSSAPGKNIEEDTFEPEENDVTAAINETFESNKTEEHQEEEDVEERIEIEERMEERKDREIEEEVEGEEGKEAVHEEETLDVVQETEKEDEEEDKKQEEEKDVEEEEKDIEKEEDIADDIIQRSAEVQSEDESEPIEVAGEMEPSENIVSVKQSQAIVELAEENQQETVSGEQEKTEEVQEDVQEMPTKTEDQSEMKEIEISKISEVPVETEEVVEIGETEKGGKDVAGTSYEVREVINSVPTETSIEEERPPSENTRSRSIQKTPAPVTKTLEAEQDSSTPSRRTRSASRQRDVVVEEPEPSRTPRSSTRQMALKNRTPSELLDALFPRDELERKRAEKTPSKKTRTSRSESANRRSASRTRSVEVRDTLVEQNTPKRGRPRKTSETVSSTEKRKRGSSVPTETETPTKRARGRPRLTPLKAIPEDEPSTSNSRNEGTSETSAAVPGRVGKPKPLEDVCEEDEDVPVQESSLRRSSRLSHN
ncbi:hypothetical protein GCK72_010026 [Caenorhabditis remanei]|uniref:Uncharacterized protein n=1 Tax=Caenorhabditis remanei TaxID=31234 RepID=A0A6A5H1S9_CAERE|nr:hypothetical protein GCK72_010026 [Caenorhabditis remanei]KAF1761770.1 hypothetical protein GCK72_010026 [Caenorhabditis remanei]